MKDAKTILYEHAEKNDDGFIAGQVKWIVEAMEEYAQQAHPKIDTEIGHKLLCDMLDFGQCAVKVNTDGTQEYIDADPRKLIITDKDKSDNYSE